MGVSQTTRVLHPWFQLDIPLIYGQRDGRDQFVV